MRNSLYVLYRDVVINGIICSKVFPRGLRWMALRAVGMDIQRCSINGNAFFGTTNVSIGRDVFINNQAFIDTAARVTIGDRVSFGPRVTIITGTHEVGVPQRRAGANVAKPVTIGAGSWLGANVTVMPGVTIGEGAVIAAGAVVTRDCLTPGVYAGVPARLVRELSDMVPA